MKHKKPATKTPLTKRPIIYAFIDSQNLNLGVRDQGWKLDFGRFRIYLEDKYGVSKCYLFIGYVPRYEPLYKQLKKDGYLLVFKPTLMIKDKGKNSFKGNVDAELVLHSMIEYPNYDKAIIVSGDGDFHCLAEYLRWKGKLLKIIIPNKERYSLLYHKFWLHLLFLSNLRNKLEVKKR